MTSFRIRFLALYLLGVIANMCASFQAPLVASLGHAFGVEPNMIGFAMSAQFLAYLFGGSAVGALVARTGVRSAAQCGLLLIVLTSVFNSQATSLGQLIAGNLAQGIGMLTTVVAAQIGVAASASEESRARAIAIWATAPLIGLASGLLLSSFFAEGERWPGAFFTVAGIALMSLVSTIFLPSGALTSGEGTAKSSGLASERDAFRLCLAVAFSVTTINGSVSSWPTYLSRIHETTSGWIGGVSSAAMLAGVAGSLGVGVALGRGWGGRRLLALIVPVAIASAIVVFGAFAGLPTVIAAMFAWHLAAGATTGLLFATLPSVLRDPDNLPAATGLLYQFAAVGTMLGAPLYLWLASIDHAATALSALTCGAIVAILLAFPASRSPRTPAPSPAAAGPPQA